MSGRKGFLPAAAGLLWLAVLSGEAAAVSNGTQAGAFLLIGNGARATAMGEAFTGLADDVTAAYWNPAGLAALPALQASLSYAAWFADTSYSVVSIGAPVTDRHVLAATIYYFHVPRIENVTSEPAVDLTNYAIGASYAYEFARWLSLGAGIKILSQDIEQSQRPDSSAAGAMVDLAVRYVHEQPAISAGFVLQNMGPKMEFRDARSPAPFWARLGVAWEAYRDEWLDVKATMDVSQPVDGRYKLNIPDGGIAEIHRISLKTPSQNRYNYGLGTEWWIANLVALRAGWVSRVGSDINSPTAGAGLRFTVDPFVYLVDYSYAFWGDLSPNVSRVSFAISLAPRQDAPRGESGW